MISGWKPPPRNGTCTTGKPALNRNRSAVRCVVEPTPADAYVNPPGAALGLSTKSFRFLMPFDGAITSALATLSIGTTPAKSLAVSYDRFKYIDGAMPCVQDSANSL